MSWETYRLGDILTLKRGHDLPSSIRQDGDVPVVSSSGITGWHNEYKSIAPGIVTGRYGTLGEVFFINENYWPLNTALYVTDFKGSNPRFLYYLLKFLLRNQQSDKAAVPGVNRNVLHELKVKFTSNLVVQDLIAEILNTYEELIENNTRQIQLLEESSRQLYKKWFDRLRFPGHEQIKVEDGVPAGWFKKTLGEITRINQVSLGKSFNGVIGYIDIASVSSGSINEIKLLDFRDAPSRARRILRHGDIIWSCVRPNLRAHAVIWNPTENLIASTGFAVITPVNLPTSFIYQAITTDQFVGYLQNNAKGAAYPAVVASDFERAIILVPPDSLLKEFDDFAAPLLTQINILRSQNVKLTEARDLLLPRLMNGEIRV